MRRKKFLVIALVTSAFAAACGTEGSGQIEPIPPQGAPDTNDAGADSAKEVLSPDAADDGQCTEEEVARLCVRGETVSGSAQEDLRVGGKVFFQVFPRGCHSSSHTIVREASCSVTDASTQALKLSGKFCLGSVTGGGGGTPDCNGGGFGRCEQDGLVAGNYTATLGNLTIAFTVPSKITVSNSCTGSQF